GHEMLEAVQRDGPLAFHRFLVVGVTLRIFVTRILASSRRKLFAPRRLIGIVIRHRSEEHTSELQSLTNLVCRLLLEKKKHYRSLKNYISSMRYLVVSTYCSSERTTNKPLNGPLVIFHRIQSASCLMLDAYTLVTRDS